MKSHEQIDAETQAIVDETPLLTEFWGEFRRDHEPNLPEFTDYLAQHCGSLILWRMENTGERFSEWMERRVGEDE